LKRWRGKTPSDLRGLRDNPQTFFMNDVPEDRPNAVDRFFLKMMQPENLGRILRWAWLISLFMLALGYILIFSEISQYVDFI
jgi:hypothetical protein